jgi:hypothetical protein
MFVSLNCALSPICNDVIQVGSIRYCAPELLTPDNLAKYNEQADVCVGHFLPAHNTFVMPLQILVWDHSLGTCEHLLTYLFFSVFFRDMLDNSLVV